MVLEAGESAPLAGLELAFEQHVADHPSFARDGVQREQPRAGELVAALVAVKSPEQLVAAADCKSRRAARHRLLQRGSHGCERRGDQLLLAVLAPTDVVEVMLSR